MRPTWVLLIAAAMAGTSAAAPSPVEARQGGRPAFEPPLAGTWEPLESLGQPRRWRPVLSLGFGVDGTVEDESAGPTGAFGVYRPLFNPVTGALGVSAHGYIGQRGEALDGGARVLLESPAVFLHAGLDWNARLGRKDLTLGVTFPLRRGGWLRRGDELRLEWIPRRENSYLVGLTLPVGQAHKGRTRPRHVDVELPKAPRVKRAAGVSDPSTAAAVVEVGESMRWLVQLHKFFWLMDHPSLGYAESVTRSRQVLADFRRQVAGRGARFGEPYTYEREAAHYHGALERAFGLAENPYAGGAAERGRRYADQARRVTLEEVVLPYNRTVGRYKQPDHLRGLTARARARFVAWYDLERGGAPRQPEVVAVLDAWLEQLEGLRRQIAGLTRDSRTNWLPLALVLRAEQHETQAQIDGLIELALGRGFESGNATLYVDALRFQHELARTLEQTERYHVLWIHDFRGRDAAGDPDRTGFAQSMAYLRALLDGVRRYDETARLPAYLIVMDQYHYEENDGRLWLDLLERPLEHRPRLPAGFSWMADSIAGLQDSLRAAVVGSVRMGAAMEAFGERWAEQVVKVHVNITNPSDLSFRSRRLVGPPIGGDNLMRDHRKLVIRDVTESDPGRGEVILAGVGVGDHYATPTWDDRALILQGPAAVHAKTMLRRVLERNGLRGARMPAPLRADPVAPDHAERVRRLETNGATARVLQAHNRTGWGEKEATFVQMLLYDLVPAGTVLYVPDSLWTSYQWMAQLVSAALRGCEVIVVAPALEHAPSAGFPQMSVMQELVTRLVLVQEEFGKEIENAGGALRVGLYAQRAPFDELPDLLAAVEETYVRHPFLQRLFPFTPETRGLVAGLAFGSEDLAAAGWSPADAYDRVPQMHRKTQLIASAATLEALASAPATVDALEATLAGSASNGGPEPSGGMLADRARTDPSVHLLRAFEHATRAGDAGEAILYFMTGSMNKNVRSMALDGEAQAVVAGPWALQAYLDFALLSGSVAWVDGLEDVEALLPPFTNFQRWIGRWLHSIL